MKERTIELEGIRERVTLCRIKVLKAKPVPVIMETITEAQEKVIDNSEKIYGETRFIRKDNLLIPAKCIYLYGEVNFDNEEDIKFIERFDLIEEEGALIPSNFDYNAGNAVMSSMINTFYTTFDAVKWFMYCHCLIGKPERIIVYRIPSKERKNVRN